MWTYLRDMEVMCKWCRARIGATLYYGGSVSGPDLCLCQEPHDCKDNQDYGSGWKLKRGTMKEIYTALEHKGRVLLEK